ncbi:hypothetical protein [Acinetobacter lwoffii]|uniref:Uncharacterized protein n=1 Tax=Acinetobacter lwoffii TaxID=28090 RepID=A0A6N1MJ01_ACILW|nr:hypothetical protein [Acinetobacter lwoffii]QKU22149.1 hypothetical protein FOB19_12530 [Acinetobacter lwoffii]
MVASTDIKFYVHTNSNAPQLQNAYGSMINVLDACLINGINIGTVSSLTASGTTVTALFSSAHNLMQYQVIKITGANQPEFNGEHRVLTIPNAQSITFELAAAPSTATATGTITASLPPLGWEKPFSSTSATGGKGAYRSKNLLLPSRPFLRVVDELDPAYTATYAKYAKVGIVEDMTGIDTLLGVQAPYDSAAPDKNWVGSGSGTSAYNGWAKWYYAKSGLSTGADAASATVTSGDRPWIIVGNSDYFYILNGVSPSDTNLIPYGFGSFISFLNTDNANCFLSASLEYVPASSGAWPASNLTTTSTNKLVLQRNYAGAASVSNAGTASINPTMQQVSSGNSDYVSNVATSGYVCFADVYIKEGAVLRGAIPNLHWVFQNKPLNRNQLFEKGGNLYIAPYVAIEYQQGQIILKIGEL